MLYIAGVDEAGRGPLAGPVFAAAVILNPDDPIHGLTDSKKLSAAKREYFFDEIQRRALAFAISRAEVDEIDSINILQASLLAMKRAVEMLTLIPHLVQVDGNQCPKLLCHVEAIVQGDLKIPAISAASILAKVARDRALLLYDQQYPGYGFAQHKGYGTKLHLEAIQQLGITPIHRRSFAPIKRNEPRAEAARKHSDRGGSATGHERSEYEEE